MIKVTGRCLSKREKIACDMMINPQKVIHNISEATQRCGYQKKLFLFKSLILSIL